jgi:hypothetical protein
MLKSRIGGYSFQEDKREEQACAVVEDQSEHAQVNYGSNTEYLALNYHNYAGHWLHDALKSDKVGHQSRLSLHYLTDNRHDRKDNTDHQENSREHALSLRNAFVSSFVQDRARLADLLHKLTGRSSLFNQFIAEVADKALDHTDVICVGDVLMAVSRFTLYLTLVILEFERSTAGIETLVRGSTARFASRITYLAFRPLGSTDSNHGVGVAFERINIAVKLALMEIHALGFG